MHLYEEIHPPPPRYSFSILQIYFLFYQLFYEYVIFFLFWNARNKPWALSKILRVFFFTSFLPKKCNRLRRVIIIRPWYVLIYSTLYNSWKFYVLLNFKNINYSQILIWRFSTDEKIAQKADTSKSRTIRRNWLKKCCKMVFDIDVIRFHSYSSLLKDVFIVNTLKIFNREFLNE